MQMPLVMLHGDYSRASLGQHGRIAGYRGNVAGYRGNVAGMGADTVPTTAERGDTVKTLISQGLDVALSWLDLQKQKTISATDRAKIDAEIAALSQGKTPEQVYGMQYLPWIVGGAAAIMLLVFFSKQRGGRR